MQFIALYKTPLAGRRSQRGLMGKTMMVVDVVEQSEEESCNSVTMDAQCHHPLSPFLLHQPGVERCSSPLSVTCRCTTEAKERQ